ncbi:SURF1 family protein [Croceicoccus bisphenolivorans]|uniref:SURF1 family protein n=1 Tax=Croceicoccus bisphenolivorans TaxID=1783232 RepID=UPI000AAE7C1A|nr:SURF1 family protein [Croceicoccus bisphenolivorans]
MTTQGHLSRIPLIATIIVLAAVATMIGLGIWQLQRLQWKEALLARYETALASEDSVAWPTTASRNPDAYYRRSTLDCVTTDERAAMSGRNADDEAGWVQLVQCNTADGAKAWVQLGWSRSSDAVAFGGGTVTGRIAPYEDGVRLVADPPLAGLEANAAPDPRAIPNNHFAYAMQWFFFAVTALVIYGIALRKRVRR